MNQAGSALAYSTYLGGLEADLGRAIAVGSEGEACVTGTTKSSNFPTANAIQPANASGCIDNFSNCTDAFAAKLSQSGDQFVYSTYIGGASRGSSPFQAGDSGAGIAVDQTGAAFVVKLNVSGSLIYCARSDNRAHGKKNRQAHQSRTDSDAPRAQRRWRALNRVSLHAARRMRLPGD